MKTALIRAWEVVNAEGFQHIHSYPNAPDATFRKVAVHYGCKLEQTAEHEKLVQVEMDVQQELVGFCIVNSSNLHLNYTEESLNRYVCEIQLEIRKILFGAYPYHDYLEHARDLIGKQLMDTRHISVIQTVTNWKSGDVVVSTLHTLIVAVDPSIGFNVPAAHLGELKPETIPRYTR